jgi:hypothetical protein
MKAEIGPSGARIIRTEGGAMARHTGVVCYLNEAENCGEIAVTGTQPVSCNFADLRRCGADQIGTTVDFELGAFRSAVSGAINITKPGPGP